MPKTPSHLASSPFRQPEYRQQKREEWRARVRRMRCPKCGAGEARFCIQPDGAVRQASHMERVQVWERVSGDKAGSQAWRRRRAAGRAKKKA